MATTLNVRFRSDVLHWIDRLASETGLSKARVAELAMLYAMQAGWHPTSTHQNRTAST